MTEIHFGSRLDAIEWWKNKLNVEFYYFDEKDSNEEAVHKFVMTWNGETLPPSHIVFVTPPSCIKSNLVKPRKTRHLIFEDELPQNWKAWAKDNKIKPTELGKSPEYLIAGLVAGAQGFPKFTPEAAKHLVMCSPGGLQAIWWPVQQVKAMGYPEPISLEHALEAWPFVVHKGRSYAVNLSKLLKALGTSEAIKLVSEAPEREGYSGLMGLKVACQPQLDRLQLLNSLIQGVDDKRWTPKAALLIFTHLCFIQRSNPSWLSQKSTLSLSSPALTQLYRLLGIPF
jgi:hypothetical protein